jgi:hypothetical protein
MKLSDLIPTQAAPLTEGKKKKKRKAKRKTPNMYNGFRTAVAGGGWGPWGWGAYAPGDNSEGDGGGGDE